jgi:hypothetical protein
MLSFMLASALSCGAPVSDAARFVTRYVAARASLSSDREYFRYVTREYEICLRRRYSRKVIGEAALDNEERIVELEDLILCMKYAREMKLNAFREEFGLK